MATPVLAAAARSGRASAVGCVAEEPWREVFDFNPHVQRVHLCPPQASRLRMLQVALELRSERYDAVALLRRDRRSALIARLAGISERVGAMAPSHEYAHCLTKNVHFDGFRDLHEAEMYYVIMEGLLGAPLPRLAPEFRPPDPLREQARETLRRTGLDMHRRTLVVHLGTGGSNRPWHPESYRRLIDWGVDEAQLQVAVTGEAAMAIQSVPRRESVFDLCGKTDLVTLSELLRLSSLLVAVDGGVVHLAASVGCPCVTLYPALNKLPRRCHPWGIEYEAVLPTRYCADCTPRKCERTSDECVRSITADSVLRAAGRALAKGPNSRSA